MKLLIGYGNTLRQDDGAGWLIASQLAPDYADSNVMVQAAHQLMPEYAALAAQAEQVIFVDASATGPAGQVLIRHVEPASNLCDTHTLQPSGILYLARTLYGHTPPALLVTIAGAEFELSDQLSPAVTTAMPAAIIQIKNLLATKQHQHASKAAVSGSKLVTNDN